MVKTLLERLVWPLLVASILGMGAAFSTVRDLVLENSFQLGEFNRRMAQLEHAVSGFDDAVSEYDIDQHRREDREERAELRSYLRELERAVYGTNRIQSQNEQYE